MSPSRLAAGLLCTTVLAIAAQPSSTFAASVPITISAEANVSAPDVAVDENGVGHFAWTEDVSGGPDITHYCRIPRGGKACTDAHQWTLTPSKNFTRVRVLAPGGGRIWIIASRCCDSVPAPDGRETDNPQYAIVSNDGGTTFAPPRIIGVNDASGDAIAGPGDFAVSSITSVVTAGTFFSANPIDGFTRQTVNMDQSGLPANKSYGGSIALLSPTIPMVGYSDLGNTFWRLWGGSGDVNDIGTWGPEHAIANTTEPKLVGGAHGIFLVDQRGDYPHQLEVRRYDQGSGDFAPPATISTKDESPIFPDAFQDAHGDVGVVWIDNGDRDPLVYRVSTDGKTFSKRTTLVGHTDDEGFNPQLGLAPDGGGWAVYDNNDHGPIKAGVVPPASSLTGGATGGGACVPQVSFNGGKVVVTATTGCLAKGPGGEYVTHDPVRVNGLDIVPGGGGSGAHAAAAATITVNPAQRTIRATGTLQVQAGNVVLDRRSFTWHIPNGSSVHVSTFKDLGKFKVSLLGFPIVGTGELDFTSKGTKIPIHLKLPAIFGGVTGEVTLRTDSSTSLGLRLDNLHVHVGDAFLGALEVRDLDVKYNAGLNAFEGGATFLLPPAYSKPGVKVAFGLNHGQFAHAEGTVGFDPPLALAPPYASLQAIGLALKVSPLTIDGGIKLVAGTSVAGKSAIAIDALPPQGFTFTLSNPAELKISGSLTVVEIPVANGFVDFKTSGLLSFGGGVDFTAPAGLASVTAGIPNGPPLGPAFVSFKNGHFNAPISGDVCVPAGCGVIDVGAKGVISSTGVAACGEFVVSTTPHIGVSAGFGYRWGQSVDAFGSLGGCDVGPYRASATRTVADAAQSGAGFTVGKGERQVNVAVDGDGSAPNVVLTLPGGETVGPIPPGAGGAKSTHAVMFRAGGRLTILIGSPPAGSYAIAAAPGSPAITRVRLAKRLPDPSVKATIGGHGHRRTLRYRIRAIPGQRVRFLERSGGVGAEIATAKGATGTLHFTPAGGPSGRRTVVALVEQNGVPRREMIVGHYRAPRALSAGRPRHVRVRRSRSGLVVTWGRAARAKRYLVRVRLRDGRRLQYVVSGRTRRLRVRSVRPQQTGSITVAGLRVGPKPGPAARARVTAPHRKHRSGRQQGRRHRHH